jgi:hypothetical protein
MTFQVPNQFFNTSVPSLVQLDENFESIVDYVNNTLATTLFTKGWVAYTSNGTFTVPDNISSFKVLLIGGGGGGGGGTSWFGYAGGGGGGAGMVLKNVLNVTPGQQYQITVGLAGTAGTGIAGSGTSPTAGGAGSATTVTGPGGVSITALGGGAGSPGTGGGYGAGGAGGGGSGGDLTYTGTAGTGSTSGCSGDPGQPGGAPGNGGISNSIRTINGVDTAWYNLQTLLPNFYGVAATPNNSQTTAPAAPTGFGWGGVGGTSQSGTNAGGNGSAGFKGVVFIQYSNLFVV